MRIMFAHSGLRPVPVVLAAASAAVLLAVAGPALAAGCGGRIQTGHGTSALALAQRCGTTLQELQRANPMIDTKRPLNGQIVRIPQPRPKYIPDSMARGAPPPSSVLPPVPHGHPTIRPPAARPSTDNRKRSTYTIRRGDTLSTIAVRAGIPLGRLVAANPDVDPHRLAIGQKIALPSLD